MLNQILSLYISGNYNKCTIKMSAFIHTHYITSLLKPHHSFCVGKPTNVFIPWKYSAFCWSHEILFEFMTRFIFVSRNCVLTHYAKSLVVLSVGAVYIKNFSKCHKLIVSWGQVDMWGVLAVFFFLVPAHTILQLSGNIGNSGISIFQVGLF